MKPNPVVITAIIVLCIIQLAAMYFGINGTLRTIIVMIIAGLAGWRIPTESNGIIKIKDVN